MESSEFDIETGRIRLGDTTVGSKLLLRGTASLGIDNIFHNTLPVDRTHFFADSGQLREKVDAIAVELVGHDDEADARTRLNNVPALPAIGARLNNEDIQELSTSVPALGENFLDIVQRARKKRENQLFSQAWWLHFANEDHYTQNVFQTDPTEQFIIGRDQIEPTTVYNFGKTMKRDHIRSIVSSLVEMSEMTRGYSRQITPYIIVHEAFRARYFERTADIDQPAGQAWQGRPFIELRRSAFSGPSGSVGQSWLEQVVAHEQSHQIDYNVNPQLADFGRFFHYIDSNGDGIINYTQPKEEFAQQYPIADISQSKPLRDYGLTNEYEDLAVVAEELVFGGDVEPLRRDAYLSVIRQFIEEKQAITAEPGDMPRALSIERLSGNEIKLPLAPGLTHPIRLRVNKHRSLRQRLAGLWQRPGQQQSF